jgi:hypothetical protein
MTVQVCSRGSLRAVVARFVVAAAAVLIPVAVQAVALPQSWNNYRWARTAELTIRVGDNVSAVWDPYLASAIAGWNTAANIDYVHATGLTSAKTCAPVYGGVQACSANYGATGWLGYATVWTAGGFIVQATVKLNDYYFAKAAYNNDAWRSLTACQELGHTLGLDHRDTNNKNANLGTCMDYTNDPSGLRGTNGTLSNMTPGANDFLALAGIYATVNTTQLAYTKPQFRTGDGMYIGEDLHPAAMAVPEPATWSLLILGFGLTGAAMRRRKSTPQAV